MQRSVLYEEVEVSKKFNYAQYLTWEDDKRIELINGVKYEMFPGPMRIHQKVSRNMLSSMHNFLAGKECEVYAAPFDVRLPIPKEKNEDKDIYNVVQPDICLVCDASKLDDKGCLGAPDLIIEILSTGTTRKDLTLKYALYERAGVKEYWVVYPMEQTIQVFILDESNTYHLNSIFEGDEPVTTKTLPGYSFNVSDFFK